MRFWYHTISAVWREGILINVIYLMRFSSRIILDNCWADKWCGWLLNMWFGCLISVGEWRELERGSETTLLPRSCTPQTQLNPCAGRGHRVCGCWYWCHDPTNSSWRVRTLHCHQHSPSYAHHHGQRSSSLARCWYVKNSLVYVKNHTLIISKYFVTSKSTSAASEWYHVFQEVL